jgi:hypothetical protein
MFKLELSLTNKEAAALYAHTQESVEKLRKPIVAGAAMTPTQMRQFIVLENMAAILCDHEQRAASPAPRLVRCKKCGTPNGHCEGCPNAEPQGFGVRSA